jgi:hypothetical protein
VDLNTSSDDRQIVGLQAAQHLRRDDAGTVMNPMTAS